LNFIFCKIINKNALFSKLFEIFHLNEGVDALIQEKIYLKINQFVQILATIIVSFNCVRLASMDTNTKNL
jgi:hypothetical protein